MVDVDFERSKVNLRVFVGEEFGKDIEDCVFGVDYFFDNVEVRFMVVLIRFIILGFDDGRV